MYGQRITLPEQFDKRPNVFNNTQSNFPLRDRILLTLVMEPKENFDQATYTKFKARLGSETLYDSSTTTVSATNAMGEIINVKDGELYIQGNVSGANFDTNSSTLKIDELYDVFLESLTTFNCKPATSKNNMAFLLRINDWNVRNNSNFPIRKGIIIPNESGTGGSLTFTHKARKLNYITRLTPDKIVDISGMLSMMDDSTIFANPTAGTDTDPNNIGTDRVIIEFLLVPCKSS
jgi:hypothetical protein